MATKEQLRDKLRQIEEKEFKDLIDKHYPEFKALEGKCFKIRNYYSGAQKSSDYWFEYIKIQKIGKEDLYNLANGNITATFSGLCFQTDRDGRIIIDTVYRNYVHFMLKEKEITNEEFKRAWLKLQSKISKKSDV